MNSASAIARFVPPVAASPATRSSVEVSVERRRRRGPVRAASARGAGGEARARRGRRTRAAAVEQRVARRPSCVGPGGARARDEQAAGPLERHDVGRPASRAASSGDRPRRRPAPGGAVDQHPARASPSAVHGRGRRACRRRAGRGRARRRRGHRRRRRPRPSPPRSGAQRLDQPGRVHRRRRARRTRRRRRRTRPRGERGEAGELQADPPQPRVAGRSASSAARSPRPRAPRRGRRPVRVEHARRASVSATSPVAELLGQIARAGDPALRRRRSWPASISVSPRCSISSCWNGSSPDATAPLEHPATARRARSCSSMPFHQIGRDRCRRARSVRPLRVPAPVEQLGARGQAGPHLVEEQQHQHRREQRPIAAAPSTAAGRARSRPPRVRRAARSAASACSARVGRSVDEDREVCVDASGQSGRRAVAAASARERRSRRPAADRRR